MRDYRNAKVMAQTLRDELGEKSLTLSHSESLELVAHMLGLRDWNVLAAKIDGAPATQPAEAAPVAAGATAPRVCAFCGKTQHEVARLIAGPAAFICDGCVGLCHAILLDDESACTDITRDSLAAKSAEALTRLKAKIARSLSAAQRQREALASAIPNAPPAIEAQLRPQAALFQRKSPEERRICLSEIDVRIGALERAIALVGEALGQTATARKSDA